MTRGLVILAALWSGQLFATSAAPLFAEILDASPNPPARILASYPVKVNFEPLNAGAGAISIQLPGSDVQVEITRVRFELGPNGGYHWIGNASDLDVVLTVDGPRIAGFIRGRDTYVIASHVGGVGYQQSLDLVDPDALPPDIVLGNAVLQGSIDQPAKGSLPDFPRAQCFGASDEPIDVLVAYSPTALAQSDGDIDLLRNRLENAEARANTTLSNSNVPARISIVAIEPAPSSLSETGTAADLDHARDNVDLRALRRLHGADVVVYLVGGGPDDGPGYCGVTRAQRRAGEHFYGIGYDFYDSAVLVLLHDCMVLENDLSHEIGHIVGLDHNPQSAVGSPASNIFPFSFGHFVNKFFRDDMSGGGFCSNECPRKMFFSDPNMLSDGYPRGTDSRNNAETYRRMYRCTNTLADFIFVDNFE